MVLVVAVAAVSVARPFDEQPESRLPHAGGLPAQDGVYVEGNIGAPQTLNPLLARSPSERDLASVLFRGLTRVDGTGAAQPDLAEDWSVSDNGLAYTFTLRPDVIWHDGQPVTARDILFTVRLVQDPKFPGDPALATFWRSVVVEIPDEYTVVFHLLEPFSAFPNYASLPIVPRHALSGTLTRDLAGSPFSRKPVGTGPFRVEEFDRSEDGPSVRLVRFEQYRGPTPYLDEVVFQFYRDSESLLTALRSGTIDGTGSLPVGQIFRPGALPDDAVVYAPQMAGYTAMFFNLRTPPFTNLAVRRAIELAIDRQQIVTEVVHNRVEPGVGPIPSSSWAFAPGQPPRVDRNAARKLLSDAGWQDSNNDGVRDNGGVQLSFPLLVNGDDPQRTAVATAVSRQLAQIGVQAQLHQVSSAEVSQMLTARQFSAAVFGWRTPTGDPDCYQLWHSSQADDGLNFAGLRDERIDALLAEGRQTTDQTKRQELYAQFQQAFEEALPAVVLYYPRYYFVVSADVQGIEPTPVVDPSHRLYGLPKWFTETTSASPQATP